VNIYEYKDVTVSKGMAKVYAECYSHFGWVPESNSSPPTEHSAVFGNITLIFKRDKKIRNKAELSRLGRRFEAAISEISSLEKSKFTTAVAAAFIAGIIGIAFIAAAIFIGALPVCIIMAIPGVVGLIIPYFLFRRISRKRGQEVSTLIEQKNKEIHEVCEQARTLLAD